VVVTSSAARSSVRTWIDMLHPQAAKVVYFPDLSFRAVSRLVPITPLDEIAGLDLVRVLVEDGDAGLAAWADVVWCQWPGDADFLRSMAPPKPVLCIPPALTCPAPRPAAARHGLVIVATEGHDVLAANEDAAVRALQDIVGQIRPDGGEAAPCTVVSDSPTPMLIEACRGAGARIVASSALGEEIRAARMMLSAHQYGGGQPEAIALCLESGTPFVVTPEAAADFDLGSLATVAVCGSVADMATRSRQLLFDDRRWSMFAGEAGQVLAARYDPAFRSKAMSAALAALGVTPGDVWARWPSRPVTRRLPRPLLKPRPDLRPGPVAEPPPLDQEAPSSERERYQIWSQRHGASAEVVRAIRQDLQRLSYLPRISVLMPVYNTDPSVLLAAIDSVLAQVYDHWQLCIANDGSDRPETLEVLASLSADKRIRVVNLPGSSGIAGATNAALALAEGEYVTFLDHDDELKPHALAQVARWLEQDPGLDVVYSDEDKIDPDGSLYDPHIKPDWSPDQLTAQNYICHLTVARRALVEEVGGLRSEFDGSQDFDLILRLTEKTDRIAHIPEPLYSWRAVPGSAAADAEAKPYAIEAARRAIGAALERRGYGGRVDPTDRVGFFRARYPIPGRPRVSIVIPTKNGLHLLERCIASILDKSTYRNFDILVVDNQSTEAETLAYLAAMPWRVIRYPQRFNYARMINLAARAVECDALLFLNNDTEVITPDWIEALLEHAMRPEVGAVGGRLYFGSGEPQHEGIMVGVGGGWAHNLNHRGYWGRGDLVRNVSAVTGACTMIRPSVYWRVGGNDERLRVAYNDVDLCMRIRQAGYQIVYTPFAELYHYESSSRGSYEHHEDGPLFGIRWHPKVIGDDYYSPMFEINSPFAIKV
jgi:GT2 family glycosyltransferase